MSDPYAQRTAAAVARTSPDVIYDVDTTSVVTPTDRVRWASILAGLFTVMASLIFFTVLGIALGFAAYDPNQPNNYGLGAGVGIYGIIVGLLSFFLGGYVAARTAAVAGTGNGFLQGALVWMVTLVLVVNLLGAGIGTLLGITANAAAEVAGGAAAEVVDEAADAAGGGAGAVATAVPAGGDSVQAAATQVQGAANQVQEQIQNVTPQQIDQVTTNVSQAAWWTLLGLGVTALAAVIGGVAGARPRRVVA